MIKEASMMANKLMIMHSAKLIAKMKSGEEKENKISELEKKAKKLGFSRAEYERILDKQNAYESIVREEADVMNAYIDGISNHKSLFYEQPGVRKVDFVDGITPEIAEEKCEECGKDPCECEVEEGVAQYLAKKGQFEVKYASSKKGPIKVTKFASLDKAKEFLASVKKDGMNGMISKGGKPVKEENVDENPALVGAAIAAAQKALEKAKKENKKNLNNEVELAGEATLGKGRFLSKKEREGLDKDNEDPNQTPSGHSKKPSKNVAYDEKKMKALAKKDKLIAKKMKTSPAKTVFNSEVLGDSSMERKYQNEELEEHCGECGVEGLQEADYELYHKDFSSAMQHAYAHAKKRGYVVDTDEIDNKVATGPKKPSSGKTNKYILGTNKRQKVHIQVANLDNKKYELNMYIEDTDPLKKKIDKKVEKEVKKDISSVMGEEEDKPEHHDPKDYAKKVAAVNKMFKVKSPKELSPEKKKKYFDTLDKMHKAKGEKPEIGESPKIDDLRKKLERTKEKSAAAIEKTKQKLIDTKKSINTQNKVAKSGIGSGLKSGVAPTGSAGKTSTTGTTTDSKKAVGAKLPPIQKNTQKPKTPQKNSYVPKWGNFLEDTRVFMNGLWEKAAKDADGMDMSGPPPIAGKKTMTKKPQEKIEINPKEVE